MSRIHKLDPGFERMVRSEFVEPLRLDVLAPLPDNPRDILTPSFRAEILERADSPMRRILRESDRHDWHPRAPVFLHHGSHDDIVPYFNAQMAVESMRRLGGRVRLYPYLGQDHYQPVNTYLLRTLADFAEA
jgi:acetyl esterase/lipase